MAHVYRAVWTDNSISLFDVVPQQYSEWLQHRPGGIDITRGATNVVGSRTSTWTEIETDGGTVMELHLREAVNTDAIAWITVLTAFVDEGENIIVADLYTESNEAWGGVIFAPKVVRGILLAGGDPIIGSDNVDIQPREIDDQESLNELVDGLNEPERLLPYLIIRGGNGPDANQSMQRAIRASETLAGIAQVFVIDEDNARFLNPLLGEELWIEERSARIMMPGVMDDVENPTLSYAVSFDELDDDMKTLGRLMLRHISRSSHWPELPEEWLERKRLVAEERVRIQESHGAAALPNALPIDVHSAESEIARLRAEVDLLQKENFTAAIAVEEKNEDYKNLLDWVAIQVSSDGDTPTLKLGSGTIRKVIDDMRAISKFVEIPNSAERDLDVLEANLLSSGWAKDLAMLFVAMEKFGHAITAGTFQGDFLMWCRRKGGFPDKKIAMHESRSTNVQSASHNARVFAVDKKLSVSGLMYMPVHAKIQERGNGDIPRVFFHDDLRGVTKKIHIGFIGPHHLVPNSTF